MPVSLSRALLFYGSLVCLMAIVTHGSRSHAGNLGLQEVTVHVQDGFSDEFCDQLNGMTFVGDKTDITFWHWLSGMKRKEGRNDLTFCCHKTQDGQHFLMTVLHTEMTREPITFQHVIDTFDFDESHMLGGKRSWELKFGAETLGLHTVLSGRTGEDMKQFDVKAIFDTEALKDSTTVDTITLEYKNDCVLDGTPLEALSKNFHCETHKVVFRPSGEKVTGYQKGESEEGKESRCIWGPDETTDVVSYDGSLSAFQ